jgi:hypothetical protein
MDVDSGFSDLQMSTIRLDTLHNFDVKTHSTIGQWEYVVSKSTEAYTEMWTTVEEIIQDFAGCALIIRENCVQVSKKALML